MDQTAARAIELLGRAAQAIDPEQVVISYNGDSDSLIVHLFGRGIPAVSVLITDSVMLRFDRANDRVVGFQIDHFLTSVAWKHPELLAMLDIAELHEITADEVAKVRREIAQRQRGALVGLAFGELNTIATAAD